MTRIAPVRLMYNPKTLWFDAGDLEIEEGQNVVVTTARGTEYGTLAEPIFEMTDDEVKQLKNPLKPVKRVGTDADAVQAEEMHRLSLEAMPVFRELAAEDNETMRPISVEYLLEGDKAIFYFEAEERIDFRDLVRKLAAQFHVRVDMRQIGVRDEARMIGGLGHCGQELCCKRLGGEFNPVTIKMAKEQDLSLNPTKISGVCGRLMCCLRYEYEAYKDFHARAPKGNATIQTPVGPAKVTNLDALREVITVRTEEGKDVKIPLADMEPPAEGARPSAVGKDAWEKATTPVISMWSASTLLRTDQFTEEDQLGTATAVRRSRKVVPAKQADAARGTDAAGSAEGSESAEKSASRKRRRRSGRSKDAAAKEAQGTQASRGSDEAAKGAQGGAAAAKGAKGSQGSQDGNRTKSAKGSQDGTQVKVGRRSRRSAEAGKHAKPETDATQDGATQDGTQKAAVRPGHKSSELRRQQEQRKETEAKAKRPRRRGNKNQGDKQASQAGGQSPSTEAKQSSEAASKQAASVKRNPRRRKSVNLQTGKQDGNEAQ